MSLNKIYYIDLIYTSKITHLVTLDPKVALIAFPLDINLKLFPKYINFSDIEIEYPYMYSTSLRHRLTYITYSPEAIYTRYALIIPKKLIWNLIM